ncbi:MAG: SCO1664 family protein [Actinomycetota bacterium]|nr:SCO1664 family protein [Actinomycetota bacterium]
MSDSLELLEAGDVEVLGLLPYSSNYTFLARVTKGDDEALAVYKPTRGERPLRDFPDGSLARREVAAYVVSELSGWKLVPPTVLRGDAPLGQGSLQLFVHHDPNVHYFTLVEERPNDFRVFALFDAVANNADRKSGHVIRDGRGKLWAVDHGLTFHVDDKLRTVIWAFAEEPLTAREIAQLDALAGALEDRAQVELDALLEGAEIEALNARIKDLIRARVFPVPHGERPVPWPLV